MDREGWVRLCQETRFNVDVGTLGGSCKSLERGILERGVRGKGES